MKLLLHIGLHKTGTTSLQDFLSKNKKQLLEYGILYPTTPPHWTQHLQFPCCLIEHRKEFSLDKLPLYLQNLKKEIDAHNPKLVIISSETFTALLNYDKEKLNYLINELKSFFDETQLFITIRDNFQIAISMIKFTIREYFQNNTNTYNHRIKNLIPTFIYRYNEKIFEKWIEYDPNIIIKNYDTHNGNLIKHYLSDIFEEYKCTNLIKNIISNDDKWHPAFYMVMLLITIKNVDTINRKFLEKEIKCLSQNIKDDVSPSTLKQFFKYFLNNSISNNIIEDKIKALEYCGFDNEKLKKFKTLIDKEI